jgi:hypothetical protein
MKKQKNKKKHIKRICGNCKLFDPQNCSCAVVVIADPAMAEALNILPGDRIHVPVDAEDNCIYEDQYFDPTTKAMEDFNEIQEVQFWVENQQGEKTDGNGVVKMRYPEGFFGKSNYDQLIKSKKKKKK